MACEFIRNSEWFDYMTFTERRKIIEARNNDFKIKKGDKYIRQTCKEEGRVYTFIAIPEMHSICIKYKV